MHPHIINRLRGQGKGEPSTAVAEQTEEYSLDMLDLSKRDGDGGTRRRVGVQVLGRQSSTGPSSSASSFNRSSLQPIGEKKATVSFASVAAGIAQERKKNSIGGTNNESPARKQSVWKSLQTAISLFKDVLKDSQGPTRSPITDIPPQLENQDDPYALFRYLEQCALDQGAVLTMAPYCTIEVEDDKFNALVESHDLALMDYHGQTVLHITAQYCDKKEVEKLINCGADPNAEDFDGYTPLFYAAIAQKPNTAETLIKNNADINYRCKKTGRSAMHVAAQFGAMKVMELLVEKGADINVLDNVNHTPIIVSSYYARSDISAYLVDKGADTCIEDKSGIMGLMRIAYTMPTITREVFDKFVTEDVYQGERYYQLDRLVGSSGRQMFCSFYHYLVWLANMGLIEHSIFDRLTKAKWQLYAKKHATQKFIFLGVFLSVWSFVYVQPHSFIDELSPVDGVYALSIIIAMSAYVWRFISNVRLLKEKFKYLNFLKKLFDDTYQREVNALHFKGKDLENFLKKRYGDRKLTFLDDVKSSPAVLIDFLVDNLLLFFIIGKVIIFVRGAKRVTEPRMNSANDELDASVQLFINATDLFGAIVMIIMWLSCFLKLQITKKVGPFVVYMKYVMGDLSTIGTMFATLFVPAVCVFYKTTYSKVRRIHGAPRAPIVALPLEEGAAPNAAAPRFRLQRNHIAKNQSSSTNIAAPSIEPSGT